jgi:hypothetical protein
MIIAALLFISGAALGWRFNAPVILISSIAIFFCSMSMFAMFIGFELLQILITFAYLIAHQSGYLAGAYFSYKREPDQKDDGLYQNQITRPARL